MVKSKNALKKEPDSKPDSPPISCIGLGKGTDHIIPPLPHLHTDGIRADDL